MADTVQLRLLRRSLLSLAVAAFSITIAGCERSRSTLDKVRLVLSGTITITYLPHTLAQHMGLYQQEDLDVVEESVAGGKGMQALLGGSADVVAGFYETSIRVAAEGRDVRSFVTLTRYPGNVLIVSPFSKKKIERIEDLKGATVGVPNPSAQAHLFVNYVLSRHGLSPSDITPVFLGTQAAGLAAVEHGKIDVWSSFDPGISLVLKRYPNARVLADVRTQAGVQATFGTETCPGAVLYANRAWLQENRDIARRLARAIRRSLAWIHQHSAEEIAAQIPAAYHGQDEAVYLEALRHALPMYSEDGLMAADAAEVAARALRLSLESVRAANVDISKTYTNEFVRAE